MDSEASSSSGGGGGSKRPRNNNSTTNKRRTANPQQAGGSASTSLSDKLNHVVATSPTPGDNQAQGPSPASGDESEGTGSPTRAPRPKSKSKGQRRRKGSASPVKIEDIIEGFAIASFRTLEDLESQMLSDFEKSHVMTQGFTPSVTSACTNNATATTPSDPAAIATATLDFSTATTAATTTAMSPLPEEGGGMDTTEVTPAMSPGDIKPLVSTPEVQPKVPTGGSSSHKASPKTDKPKKEGAKKSKKALNNADGSTNSNVSSKENKAQNKKSSGTKANNPKCSASSSSSTQGGVNCFKNSSKSSTAVTDTKPVLSSASTDCHSIAAVTSPAQPCAAATDSASKAVINFEHHNNIPTDKTLTATIDPAASVATAAAVVKKEPLTDNCPTLGGSSSTSGIPETKPEVGLPNHCTNQHNNNNLKHKLKSDGNSGPPPPKDNIHRIHNFALKPQDGLKNENRPNNVIRHHPHHHLLIPPPPTSCLTKPDCKPNKDSLDHSQRLLDNGPRSVIRPHQIIAEEPLRQNGQSVTSSLSAASLSSDRSSSRDRLSEAGSSGRGYICDSEGEIDTSSKASDAGSESLFSTTLNNKSREGSVPPALHNGSLGRHLVPSPVQNNHHHHSNHHNHHSSNHHHTNHHHHSRLLSGLKPPAATTASLTTVTATTVTTSSVTALTVTTAATTTATSVLVNHKSSCQPHPQHHHGLPRSSSSSSLSSSYRSHTPVQPRPIPGLSGTRPEDTAEHKDASVHRPYSRGGHPWGHSSSGSTPQLPHHSSPHISPVSSLGLHHPAPPGAPLHLPGAAPPHHPHRVQPHSMFAPPIAPPPVPNPHAVDPISSSLGATPDLLGRSPLSDPLRLQFLGSSFHQHQHHHQHMHHYGGPYPGGAGPGGAGGPGLLLPPSSVATAQLKTPPTGLIRPPPSLPDLERDRHKLDKFAGKLDSPLFRPGLPSLPGPLGLSPMLHPPPGLPGAPPLGSSIHGAFQPKVSKSGTPGLHPSPMLLPHPRDKSQPPTGPTIKKSGKWCAAHVRVAWEIHILQQKHAEANRGGSDAKPSDLLRPPSHLLGGSSGLHRPDHGPPSGPTATAQALLGPPSKSSSVPHSRSPFESGLPGPHHNHNSLFSSHFAGMSPFPRPSPYPGLASHLNPTGFGGLGAIGSSAGGGYPGVGPNPGGRGADMPTIPGLTSPHEWNRLHRTPPSFPTPPAWPPKPSESANSDREKELERERERDKEARERERERDHHSREKERERDRSMSRDSSSHHHNNNREADIRHREREGSQSKDLSSHHREQRDRDRDLRDKEHDALLKRSPSRDASLPPRPNHHHHHHHVDSLMERKLPNTNHAIHRPGIDRHDRSRSRSPLRNGPETTRASPHGARPDLKVKEERKDDVMVIEDSKPDRRLSDLGLHKMDGRNNLLGLPPSSLASLYHDRRPMPGSPYDRHLASQHPALWHPFDMGQRAELVIEREREQLLRRMTNPLGLVSSAPPLALLEAEKLREHQELLLRDQALMRDRERIAMFEREHRERVLASITGHHHMDHKIPPPLRPAAADSSYHQAFGGLPSSAYHPAAASRPPSNSSYHHPSGASRPPSSPVVINHNTASSKSSSPGSGPVVGGGPPPLIPSAGPATLNNHSSASPTPAKVVKPPTPISNSIISNSNSIDSAPTPTTPTATNGTKDAAAPKVELNTNGLDATADTQAR